MSFYDKISQSLGEAMKTVNTQVKSVKEALNNFEVVCPECGSILVAPNTGRVFQCGKCRTLLENPTTTERSAFLTQQASSKAVAKLKKSMSKQNIENASIKVTIPQGCSAGKPLTVEYNGKKYTVNVPEGLSAGDDFNIEIPDEYTDANAVVRMVARKTEILSVESRVAGHDNDSQSTAQEFYEKQI